MTRERTATLIAAASFLAAATFFGGCSSTDTGQTAAPLRDASPPPPDATEDLTACLDAGGPKVGDYPCDVGKVLADKCQPWHQNPPKNGAHFSLLNYEDSQQPFGVVAGRRRWQRMAEVIEPGVVPHMPYRTASQLTAAEQTTLRRWFHDCAPPVAEGTGCDSGETHSDAAH